MKRFLLLLFLILIFGTDCAFPLPEVEFATIFPISYDVQIEAGTQLNITLNSSLNSQSVRNFDTISAQLNKDWVYKDTLIAPEGSILTGNAADSSAAAFAFGDGKIGINFTTLTKPDGSIMNLSTNKVQISADDSRAKNITTGTLNGILNGARVSNGDWTTIIAMGTFALLSTLAQKGEEVEIPAGTNITIRISKPLIAKAWEY